MRTLIILLTVPTPDKVLMTLCPEKSNMSVVKKLLGTINLQTTEKFVKTFATNTLAHSVRLEG
jgi:hypothetical protein